MSNQEICRKLVEREVIYCVSELISELAGKDAYMDEIMDLMGRNAFIELIEWYIENDMSVKEAMEWLLEYNTDMPGRGNAKDQLRAFLADEDALQEFIYDHNIDMK